MAPMSYQWPRCHINGPDYHINGPDYHINGPDPEGRGCLAARFYILICSYGRRMSVSSSHVCDQIFSYSKRGNSIETIQCSDGDMKRAIGTRYQQVLIALRCFQRTSAEIMNKNHSREYYSRSCASCD